MRKKTASKQPKSNSLQVVQEPLTSDLITEKLTNLLSDVCLIYQISGNNFERIKLLELQMKILKTASDHLSKITVDTSKIDDANIIIEF